MRQIKLAVFLDLVIIAFAGFVSWLIRLGLPAFELDPKSIYPMVAAGLLIKPIGFFFAGVYQQLAKKRILSLGLRLVIATAAALVVEFGILTLLNRSGILPTVSKSVLMIDAGITLGLVFIHHLLVQGKTKETNKYAIDGFFHLGQAKLATNTDRGRSFCVAHCCPHRCIRGGEQDIFRNFHTRQRADQNLVEYAAQYNLRAQDFVSHGDWA